MAPVAISPSATDKAETKNLDAVKKPFLKSTGSLDGFKSKDVTPVIGTEFPETNIVNDIFGAENTDQLLRDLAITISERGVVFFRAQDNLTNDLQKDLVQRLGELSGKPSSSTLHIHPVLNDSREFGGSDPHISTISSEQRKVLYRDTAYSVHAKKQYDAAVWHSDISFEKVPADYTSLRLTQLPRTGGDTLWASGYEMYDRISEPYQRFLETLTVTHEGAIFKKMSESKHFQLYSEPRGSPDNVGTDLLTVHPLIRTNPVTGWKSLFGVGPFIRHINGLAKEESQHLLKWFHDLITYGHDLQIRFNWQNPNDIAIWDNRSVFHTATNDFSGLGERFGNRAVGIGERPYYDPESQSRREALGVHFD